MTVFPPFTPLAASLPMTVPFVGPEALVRQRGRGFCARIGANESGFGPSPKVVEAVRAAAADLWMYADPENFALKQAFAAHLGVQPANVAVGGGIDGLLGLTVRLFAQAGDAVVTSLGAYPTFNFHVAGFGARLVTVPYRDDHEDLEALANAAKRENAAIVYLANPDNPMGSWREAAAIRAFVEAIPARTLVVLDEAYGETAPEGTLPSADWSRPNLLRFRTLSKAYGLAGLRVGYVFGLPELTGAYDKVRNHFGMSRIAEPAALAALADRDWLASVLARIAAARTRIGAIAANRGLAALPSATNFVAVDCGRDGAFAKRVLDGLIERDIFVRKPVAPGLDRTIRISVGPEAEMDRLEAAFGPALDAATRA